MLIKRQEYFLEACVIWYHLDFMQFVDYYEMKRKENSNFQFMFYAHIKVLSIEPEVMVCQQVV